MATALIALLLAASPVAAEGLHLAVGAGAGFSYDGVAGLRLEGRVGGFALSLGLGRDALPSDDVLAGGHGWAHGGPLHSLAGSARWLHGGADGLVLSLTLWGQWERTSAPTLAEPHPGDRWVVLSPTVGWRWLFGSLYLEASLGLPYSWQRFRDVDSEPPFGAVVVRRNGFGWSGCGRCDQMGWWPTGEIGLGLSY